jgi:diguanylate cyclase (GGDEF)-like protein
MSETSLEIPKIVKEKKVVMLKGPNRGKIRDPLVAHEEANTILESVGYASPDDYNLRKDAIKALKVRAKDYILTSQAAKTEEARKNAEFDDLTKVFNQKGIRRRVEEVIEQHNRFGTRYEALFMDIDGFREFNSSYGHQAGNEVLRDFAQFMQNQTRKYESFGRFGGDEFVSLLQSPSLTAAEEVTARMKKYFAEKAKADKRYINLSVSVGVRTLEPRQHLDAETFLYQADAAMYKAKEQRGTVLVRWKEGMSVPPGAQLFRPT